MPPLPRINTRALVDLAEELRFAPRAAVLRDIERAEGLASEVDESLTYPADWVVFRVTGYRPEMDDPPLIPGGALLGDLSALVERLCDAASLAEADIPGAIISADELASRWSVSRKTLSRWRRRGLIGRRIHDADGSTRLVFSEQSAEAYAAGHEKALARAGGFSRIDPATESRLVARARRYHLTLGWGITQTVERLAERFGRSREGVRQVLLRHDAAAAAQGGAPVFGEPGALDERARRVIGRAWRRGVEPGALVKRFGRTRTGVHRIVNEERLRCLAALDLGHIAGGALGLDEPALEALLGAAPLAQLPAPPLPTDIVELVALMRERVVPVGVEERAWSRAEHALRARASALIAHMHEHGAEAGLVDRAETDLRWAANLRAALARPQLHLVLETLESTLDVSVDQMRSRDALVILAAGLSGLRAGLDAYDPWKRGRLAAPVGLMVSRVRPTLPQRDAEGGRTRAQVRIQAGTPAPEWRRAVSPWVESVRLDARLEGARARMDPELAHVLTERLGLDAHRPRTLAEFAAERGITIMQAGRLDRRALRAGLAAARS